MYVIHIFPSAALQLHVATDNTNLFLHCLSNENVFTFSRSGSLKAKASSLLSITEAAATSRGVEPRMEGKAKKENSSLYYYFFFTSENCMVSSYCFLKREENVKVTQSNAAVFQQVAEMIKHCSLIVTTYAAKITQESTAAGHHLGKSHLLTQQNVKFTH